MKLSGILLFLLLSLQAFAEFPLLDEPGRKFKQDLWDIQTQLSYFQATANYTKGGGSFADLPSGSSYRLINLDFGLRYGFSKQWGAFALSQISSAESKNGADTRANSGLTQIVGGADYLFFAKGATELFSDISLTVPFKKVSVQSDEVLNSEGAMELSARLVARQRWRSLEFFAFSGFTYRDEGRSGLVPYGFGSEWSLSSLGLGAELRGYETVVSDQSSNDSVQRQSVAAKNGNSLKFFSVDPSLLETNFWIRSKSKSDLSWKAGGGITLTGASSGAGWNLFLGLGYAFDRSVNRSEPVDYSDWDAPAVKPGVKPEVERFREDISDEANQNYFRKTPVPVVPKPVPPKNNKDQIQKDLNQMEFQIELKRKKPIKKKRRRSG